jgi:hypothetical protein
MSEIEVTENKDLSFTINDITPDEMSHLFRKGLKTMIDEVSGGDKFVILKPDEVNIKVTKNTHEIDDSDYDQIVQLGIVKILMESFDLKNSNEWFGDNS